MSNIEQEKNLYELPVTDITGKIISLKPFENQVLLIVNVASRCGFTSQYAELETLYRDYKNSGFSVLGFPCDQFLHQEPGTNQEIQAFAESCYNVTFPLFGKIEVKGNNKAPLYNYLTQHIQKKPWKMIPWNFTKILISSKGEVLKRYLPFTSFKTIRQDIENLLAK